MRSSGASKAAASPLMASWPIWLVGLVVVVGTAAVSFYGGSTDNDRHPGRITIVEGVPQASPTRPIPLAAGPTPQVSSQDRSIPAIAELQQSLEVEFPTLRGMVIVCDKECTLTVGASGREDAKFTPDRLPYMGRLEQFIAQKGFAPIDNLMIEETGDDESVLRFSFAKGL